MKTFAAWLRPVTLGLFLGVLGGCNDILAVDLPSELTDEALNDPAGAATQLNSAILSFESASNEFTWTLHGREDGGEIVIGGGPIGGQIFKYQPDQMPVNSYSMALRFASNLHDKLQKDWTVQQVPLRSRYLAMSSIYAGAAVGMMGSSLCEISINVGPLMTPAQTLTMAEASLTTALTEIDATGGDFAMPFGISASAKTLAYGLRAQVRWMAGNKSGALSDAEKVPLGFVAYITRETRTGRRNTAWEAGNGGRFARLYDVIDWWKGSANPVTGKAWPAVLPFTGYVNLGILPDGRAVREDGLPIRTAGLYRGADESTAVADTRVKTVLTTVSGISQQGHVNARYTGPDAFIPWINWKEMFLIRAEIEGGQKAIDLVNQIRTADKLPLVTYASAGNATQVRYMIIEERRRALFLEGRYYLTKIQNLDVLWFPRSQGNNPGGGGGGAFFGGVIRHVMPQAEFLQNPNLKLTDQATGCDANQKPVL